MRLTLHAGLHKTGSSSIQVFCNEQKECLMASKCFYPTTLNLNGAHHPFASALLNSDIGLIEENVRCWRSECAELGITNIIVSSEDLEYVGVGELTRLREMTDRIGIDLFSVIYIRPQSDLVVSQYSQQVREGACSQAFSDFFQQALSHANYLKINNILDCFSEALGNRLSVGFYYNDKGLPINAVMDFADRVGIDNVSGYTNPAAYRFNARLNSLQLEILKQAISSIPALHELGQYERSQVLYNFIESFEWPDFVVNSPSLALDKAQMLEVMRRYKDDNARISEKYLEMPGIINDWYQAALQRAEDKAEMSSATHSFSQANYQETIDQARMQIYKMLDNE